MSEEEKAEEKTCFIICPIGENNSPERKRADDLLEFIILPCLNKFGYKPIRADLISKPGMITSQIIRPVIESELIIADLYGYNPNVFYELAIRHVTRKPYIQLMSKDQTLPFDIADVRTIFFDIHDLRSVEEAKKELEEHIESIVKENIIEVETPISRVIDIKTLLESKDPQKQDMANVLERLYDMNRQLKDIRNIVSPFTALIPLIGLEKPEVIGRIYPSFLTSNSITVSRDVASQIFRDREYHITTCPNCVDVLLTADRKCPKCGRDFKKLT